MRCLFTLFMIGIRIPRATRKLIFLHNSSRSVLENMVNEPIIKVNIKNCTAVVCG